MPRRFNTPSLRAPTRCQLAGQPRAVLLSACFEEPADQSPPAPKRRTVEGVVHVVASLVGHHELDSAQDAEVLRDRRRGHAQPRRKGVDAQGLLLEEKQDANARLRRQRPEDPCEATGIRNLGRADTVTNTQVDVTRNVRIEFDSNIRKLPWQFRALTPVVDVHPGELRQVVFEIVNTTDRAMTGQAIPSYGPQHAGQYFKKLECFCFARQTLQPGESRQMPVVFVVDADLPKDVPTITLSYTFFEVEGADKS